MFVEFEEGGGVFEIAALALGAVGLDLAELVEALLELPGKALALDAEVGDAAGVDDIDVHFLRTVRNGINQSKNLSFLVSWTTSCVYGASRPE